jgi:hypothetical protein
MRFGTCNVTNHYRSSSVTEAARELARYKLSLLGVQKVRWDKGGTVRAGDYKFYYVKKNLQFGTGFFVHHRILSRVKRVEFVRVRM